MKSWTWQYAVSPLVLTNQGTPLKKLDSLQLKAVCRDDFCHEIEEITSTFKYDIDVSELSTQLEILGTSFFEE